MASTTLKLPTNYSAARKVVTSAKIPQDIFGNLSFPDKAAAEAAEGLIKRIYRRYAMLLHPDRNKDRLIEAQGAFQKLEEMHTLTQEMRDRAMGVKPEAPKIFPITFKTGKYQYAVLSRKASGGTCGIFEGFATDKRNMRLPAIFRVPHSADDNDLMLREAAAFKKFATELQKMKSAPDGAKHAEQSAARLPIFIESVKMSEPGLTKGAKAKIVNTFAVDPQYVDGWFTLEEIRNQYPEGLPTKIMAFIWNRIFECLMFSHRAGFLHNAITPNHVIIHVKSHIGQIIDWTASSLIEKREGPPYVDEAKYRAYFPNELLAKDGAPAPCSDIYMSAWCMVFILGGDPEERWIPDSVEKPIREFLDKCLQPMRKFRPRSAIEAYDEFRQITRAIFGPRKFVDLPMPKAHF